MELQNHYFNKLFQKQLTGLSSTAAIEVTITFSGKRIKICTKTMKPKLPEYQKLHHRKFA